MDWRLEEDSKLREMAALGLSAREIADCLPGRSKNSVIGRARRLDVKLMATSHSHWSESIKRRFREMWEDGRSAAAIARAIGKSRDAVWDHARRNGMWFSTRNVLPSLPPDPPEPIAPPVIVHDKHSHWLPSNRCGVPGCHHQKVAAGLCREHNAARLNARRTRAGTFELYEGAV